MKKKCGSRERLRTAKVLQKVNNILIYNKMGLLLGIMVGFLVFKVKNIK
ncbi:hypothetical protein MNB_SUP05-SYMBIONT-5-1128 [hydrothermal vent metagenome]|uniref:Uncharacterized protein n=1 Tax=hydrothermal vent metagenome TaxID=652676 RepID=A0A1W1E639_9ZZZZ